MMIPFVAHSAAEHYRWLGRSQSAPTARFHAPDPPRRSASRASAPRRRRRLRAPEPTYGSGAFVPGDYRHVKIYGAGHFLGEAAPVQVNAALLRGSIPWLTTNSSSLTPAESRGRCASATPWYAVRLGGRDASLRTASVGKVLLLVETARLIAAASLTDEPLTRSLDLWVSDSVLGHTLSVETLPLIDVAALVGAVSDNLATNVLLGGSAWPRPPPEPPPWACGRPRCTTGVRDVRRPITLRPSPPGPPAS